MAWWLLHVDLIYNQMRQVLQGRWLRSDLAPQGSKATVALERNVPLCKEIDNLLIHRGRNYLSATVHEILRSYSGAQKNCALWKEFDILLIIWRAHLFKRHCSWLNNLERRNWDALHMRRQSNSPAERHWAAPGTSCTPPSLSSFLRRWSAIHRPLHFAA